MNTGNRKDEREIRQYLFIYALKFVGGNCVVISMYTRNRRDKMEK